MGHLLYANNAEPIEIDDEVLAHLRVVTVTKLRRGESFALTVPSADHVNETFWIHASIPIRFALDENVGLQRPMLAAMMEAANTSSGLDLADERVVPRVAEKRRIHAMSA